MVTDAKYHRSQSLTAFRVLLVFILCVLHVEIYAQYYQVTTIAGSTTGYADGVGVSARFNSPTGLFVDKSGNLIVSDWLNNRLRSVSPAGMVTTLAGSGVLGYLDGSATNARFQYPNGIVVDSYGNIFIADRMNHLIRKLSPAGEVTTFAGNLNPGFSDGNGLNARFNRPSALAIDQFDNIYVTDFYNHRIRKINPTGDVTTIAGSGVLGYLNGSALNARFNCPTGVTVDMVGNIYVSDYNHAIRKITSNGVVSTLAGTNVPGYAEGNGINARFNYPHHLATDNNGNVFVADVSNNRIRRVNANGDVSTIAGSIAGFADGTGNLAQFNSPYGIAIDPLGNLYVSDVNNHRIRKITPIAETNYSAIFSGVTFRESVSNTGSISTTQTITLTNAAWTSSVANGVELTPNVYYSASNVPAGLALVVTKISPTQAVISFTGSAVQHQAANSVSNLQITFLDAALNGTPAASVEGLNGKNLSLTFGDNPRAVYSGTTFSEAVTNDGTITTTRTITLAFDTFVPTGTFVQGVHYTASGIPVGLSMRITRTSQTAAEIALIGKATAHESANNTSIILTFLNAAIASSNAEAVIGLTPKSLSVVFENAPQSSGRIAAYSGTTFMESSANNGAISTVRTVTVTRTGFAQAGILTEGVHYKAIGVPQGLTMSIMRTEVETAQISFTGNALAHESIHDATIALTFYDASLTDGNAAGVAGLTPKTLNIIFSNAQVPNTAVYSDSVFIESAANNGFVNTVRTVTLVGDSFVDLGLGSFVQGTHFTVSGVPNGLSLNISRLSSSMAQISFSGNALAHSNTNDAVVTLNFLPAAVLSGNLSLSQGLTPKRLFIDFTDPDCGTVTTFAGNGSAQILDGVGIMASFVDPRDVATDALGNVYVADKTAIRKITPSGAVSILAGHPTLSGMQSGTGLNARFGNIFGVSVDALGNVYAGDYGNNAVWKISPNGMAILFAGSGSLGKTDGPALTASFANPYDVAVDAAGTTLYVGDFGNNAIRKISNGIVSTLPLSTPIVNGPAYLAVDIAGNIYVGSYAANRIYKVSSTGTVSVLAGSGIIGDRDGTGTSAILGQSMGLTLDSQGNVYFADYYPSSKIKKISPAGVVTTMAGSGSAGYNDGAGIGSSFNLPMGVAMDPSGNLFVADRLNQRIRSIYVCGASGLFPPAAEYFNTLFRESSANNGTIATSTHTITLAGTTWSPAVLSGNAFRMGIDYTVTSLPAGLTFNLVPTSSTTARMFFTGVANNHANSNDASFVLTFLNPSVTNGNVSAVIGLSPKTLNIDFDDPPQGAFALYSDTLFTETAANAGQISVTQTVTLTGASFVTGAFTNGTHFEASNVPAGLTLTVSRLSASQVRLGLSGAASAHAAANSTNFGLTFLPAAIQGGNIGIISNLTPKSLRVNFLDPYMAVYSDTLFTEAMANDGTVPTTRTLTLTGSTFTTTATTLVQGTHFNVSGVPAGLTLVVTKTSPTVAEISFTGAATAHVNDALNINLSFLNAALSVGSAAGVIGLTPRRLAINFIPPYSAVYSGKTFFEASANDGTVSTVRTLTLVGGDTLMGSGALTSGVHFLATGVPAGLTLVMTKTSATTARISFTGAAISHTNTDDVSFTLNILPAALASGNPAAVLDLTPTVMIIDFMSPATPPPSAPNILGFTPQVGTTGTVVTMSGFGFTGTRNVLFGGTPASSFTVVSDSVVTAVVENGSTGDVTIVTANGLGILPGFTYVPRPTISSFTPTSGNQGQVVTINGANFSGTALNGTNWTTTSVYFGGTPASSFTVISPTQIQATVAAGASGAVRVETLPGNVGIRNGFCYMPPTITAFSPTSASTGTQVVITGSNFTGATAVRFNGRAAASFAVVSDTEIRAFPAANTPLTGNISVTTPQCTDDLATFTFIPAPVIYGFWLSGGTNGDVITIDGINFENASAVKFGDTVAASYTIVSPTRITAVVGHGKTGAVSVIGPGGVGTRSKFIYYAPGAGRPNPPIITSFSPTEGPDGTVVTIDGLNFQGADWFTTAVRIGDAPDGPRTAIIQSMTATRLVVKVNGGATGLIRVYTPAGVTTSTQTFTYFPPPTITAFSPTTGGAGTTVTILGTEFNGVSAVRIGGVAVSSYTVNSPTQITATVGSGAIGRVTVVANGGTATSAGNFTFPTPPPAPTITSFTPALATSGTVITINGSNFTGATQVNFGGTPAQSFTVVNTSRITALVGAGASGSVTVTTPSGTASKTGFTYLVNPLPTITSFSPASAAVGQTVTILGTYFTGATQVFMGSASVPFTVHHSGRITVEVPANAASGVIRVVTPNGVALRPGFTVISAFAFLDKGNASLTSEQYVLQQQTITNVADVMSGDVGSIGLYPNPASDVVTLTATGLAEQHSVKVIVVNNLGQTVMMLDKQPVGGILQMRLDVHNLPTGAYSAVISSGVNKRSVPFVKR